MPITTAVRSESVESEGSAAYTERRYGCYGWGLITSLLLLTFIMIVSVILLVQSDDAVLLLSVLLVLMIIVALAAFGFLQWQHRQAIRRRREQASSEWGHRTHSRDQINTTTPSAPQMSARSSWVHWTPWKATQSASDNSATMPSYHVVST